MPLLSDMPAAARRNLLAAEYLPQELFQAAGYLYGLAAECAVKAMLEDLGLRPRAPEDRREDPYYKHFPVLLASSRDAASGRRSGTLMRLLNRPGFMHGWSTEIRYAATGQIERTQVARWAEQARYAVGAIGT